MDAAAVSAAAAIAAAALAASPEELLSELPGTAADCIICQDEVEDQPEPYEVQEEPEPYSPEPPSLGSYVPLDASDGGDSAGDNCSREQMVRGGSSDGGDGQGVEGFRYGMGGGLDFREVDEGSGQGSMPDDFVEKLVRRVSGGAMPAGLDLDLNLGLNLDLGGSSTAAAAATCVLCASPVAVAPVLLI
jgi:hypothetical protein